MSLKGFNFISHIPKWIRLYSRGNLTIRSIFALSLIAILNFCSFIISQDNGREQNRALVEIQRGRLHLQSLQLMKREIYVAQTIPSDGQLREETKNIIKELSKLKSEARGVWGLNQSTPSFFQDLQSQESRELGERIDSYISNMTGILGRLESADPSDRTLVATLLFELINQVRAYEADGDQFIQIYIQRLESMLSQYRLLGMLIFILTLLLIFIVGFFVFRPAITKLEKARNARSIFFSKMSHEIRNPMNSIIGMSKILLETNLDSRQKDLLMRLDLSARGLLRFLSNVIEYSYIETNKVKSGLGPIKLKNLIEETSASYSFEAYKKGVLFLVQIEPDVPAQILSDEIKLRHVILNLIGNAIKFTRVGHVKLKLKLIGPPLALELSVVDTGIGIETENLEKIFEPFEQADSSVRREHGGTGLGLSIVQEYVKDLGGDLKISSIIGKGTTVTTRIPFKSLQGAAIGPAPDTQINYPPLIVVLGDPTALHWIQEVDHDEEAQAEFYPSWNDFVRKVEFKQTPYLLIDADPTPLDARNMSDLKWKSLFPVGSAILSTPFLMSGSFDFPFGISLESSCPLYPWSLDFSRFKESEHDSQYSKSLRILVCDDSEENRIILCEYLKEYSDYIDAVPSGSECLAKLKNETFDVLFLDIQMPDMDGLTVASELTTNSNNYKKIPYLIAFTAHTDFYEKQEMKKAGFRYILNKPVSAADVKLSLAAVIKEGPSRKRPQARPHLDVEVRNETMDERIKRKMGAKKGEYLKNQIEALAEILASGPPDYESLKNYAHKLKGNAAYFELQGAAQMGGELEVLCEEAQVQNSVELGDQAQRLATKLLTHLQGQ